MALNAPASFDRPQRAVGLYDPAGFAIGRVWRDRRDPDPSAARFPEGSVGVELEFAMTTDRQVPYLANSLEWDGYVSSPSSTARAIQKGKCCRSMWPCAIPEATPGTSVLASRSPPAKSPWTTPSSSRSASGTSSTAGDHRTAEARSA